MLLHSLIIIIVVVIIITIIVALSPWLCMAFKHTIKVCYLNSKCKGKKNDIQFLIESLTIRKENREKAFKYMQEMCGDNYSLKKKVPIKLV